MDAITAKLDRIEDGFARVTNADTGTTIGYVTRDKHGSGRTSVRWTATRTRRGTVVLGYGATRAEAVAVVVKNAQRFAC
jgi:chorismate synthase